MFLTGRRVKPEEALAWGLVDEVVPQADLLDAAKALAAEIAENAPLAVVATRKTLRAGLAAAAGTSRGGRSAPPQFLTQGGGGPRSGPEGVNGEGG